MRIKLFLSTLLTAVLLTGCQNDGPVAPILESPCETIKVSKLRTPAEAQAIALNAIEMLNSNKSRSGRTIDNNSTVVIGSNTSRSGETDTLLYVINYENNAGYAVVAASQNVEPLLAVTEKGSIKGQNVIENPGMKIFMDMAVAYASQPDSTRHPIFHHPKDSFEFTPEPHPGLLEQKIVTVWHANETVGPRVTVEWGQTFPEGEYCPNGISGCTATAVAQALSYFEYPPSISLNFPERTTSDITLHWPEMKRQIDSSPYNFDRTISPYDSDLSNLLRELGYRIGMTYGVNSSSGSLINTYRATESIFNVYSNDNLYLSLYNIGMPHVMNALGNGIIIVGGMDNSNDGIHAGHCWIIDGYQFKWFTDEIYTRPYMGTEWTLIESSEYKSCYVHNNWGWNGYDNGYFSENIYKTTNYNFTESFAYFTILKQD